MKHRYGRLVLVTIMALGVLAATAGRAAPRGESRGEPRRGDGPPDHADWVMDRHFNHDHAYPPRGAVVGTVPRGAYVTPQRWGRYYYRGGIWYRPSGPRFMVVAPPVGVVVPFLPPFYTTLWVGGFPYYYANDVYYSWRPRENGYEVVAPPSGADQADVKPGSDELFIYPRNGQPEQQQATDRYECHHWAVTQTGYDPAQPGASAAHEKRADYQRAMTACLEARGYSVK